MTPEIYAVHKRELLAILGDDGKPLFKTVMLYNNQIEHLLAENNDNYVVNFPACFIQYSDIVSTNLQAKASVQQVNFATTLYIVRRIQKNEDIKILSDKLKVYQMMQRYEFASDEPTVGRHTRISETPNYDNNLLMVYEQTYTATYKDFSAQGTPNTGPVTTLTINPSIVTNIS